MGLIKHFSSIHSPRETTARLINTGLNHCLMKTMQLENNNEQHAKAVATVVPDLHVNYT
jgi:hypothetical protein